jgi:hypothetical protein
MSMTKFRVVQLAVLLSHLFTGKVDSIHQLGFPLP